MKFRMGFVSNSSSASFIVHWRARTFGEVVTTEEAIGRMFEVSFKVDSRAEGNEMDWENTWNKEIRETVEDIIAKTERNDDGTFTTVFWTSMMNSAEDFGESAKSFALALLAGGNSYQIIDTKIDSFEM